MQTLHATFVGACFAAVCMGAPLVAAALGIIALCISRSYIIIFLGAILDFAYAEHIGVFTLVFVLVTFCVEYIKARIFVS